MTHPVGLRLFRTRNVFHSEHIQHLRRAHAQPRLYVLWSEIGRFPHSLRLPNARTSCTHMIVVVVCPFRVVDVITTEKKIGKIRKQIFSRTVFFKFFSIFFWARLRLPCHGLRQLSEESAVSADFYIQRVQCSRTWLYGPCQHIIYILKTTPFSCHKLWPKRSGDVTNEEARWNPKNSRKNFFWLIFFFLSRVTNYINTK